MFRAFWTEKEKKKACWGDWCVGTYFTFQAGNTKLSLTEKTTVGGVEGTAVKKVPAVLIGADAGVLGTLGTETSAFGADFGIGPSLRTIAGNAGRSSHEDGLKTFLGEDDKTFVGVHGSVGIRVGDFRMAAFMPILNQSTEFVSGFQMVILAQVQARIASSSK